MAARDVERGQTTVEWTALALVVAVRGRARGGRRRGSTAARSAASLRLHRRAARGRLRRRRAELAARARRTTPSSCGVSRPNWSRARTTPPVDSARVPPRTMRGRARRPRPRRPLCRSAARVRATRSPTSSAGDGSTLPADWLYYPDSTTVANVAGAWNTIGARVTPGARPARVYPGFHPDDWESSGPHRPAGQAWVRASSHHGYQGCKRRACANDGRGDGLDARVARVARRPHPARSTWRFSQRDLTPRHGTRRRPARATTTRPACRLVPVESLPHGPCVSRSRRRGRRRSYRDPRSNSTGSGGSAQRGCRVGRINTSLTDTCGGR